VATAHHLEDQAETLLMRLARGAGARGLAAMRPATTIPGCDLALVRPLLGWRRAELADICANAGVQPVADPSNEDDRFERVRLRHELGQAAWLDPEALAASAAHLRDADVALDWATQLEWARSAHNGGAEIVYRPTDAPPEIRRRIVQAAIARLASEGQGPELRGRELDRLMTVLTEGNVATARGVRCAGGEEWRFSKAPRRKTQKQRQMQL
jgi:tRNA(Ile)-lysidine synthase